MFSVALMMFARVGNFVVETDVMSVRESGDMNRTGIKPVPMVLGDYSFGCFNFSIASLLKK